MRTVVVTGGAKGIGRAVVARFLGLGDRVIALGRDREALQALEASLHPAAGELATAPCDVADEPQVELRFAAIGEVDVLVNNAGTAESAPLHQTSLESWERHMAVNATGAFLCTRAVIEQMRRRGSGAIITVASTAGRAGSPYTSAYTASKHAAVGLMRAAAAELAGTGVTANAVCPTFVDTEMTQRSVQRIVDRTGRDAGETRQALARMSPLGRLITAQEVAGAVVWLASAEAATINGQALVMDGGGLHA